MHQIEIMRGFIDRILKEEIDRDEIRAIFNENFLLDTDRSPISTMSINQDGSIHIYGGVFVKPGKKFNRLPVNFKSAGDFECQSCGLTNLEGSPNHIDGAFNCSSNNLTSLKNGPEYVGRLYYCIRNHLVSLDGLAKNFTNLLFRGTQIYHCCECCIVRNSICITNTINPLNELYPLYILEKYIGKGASRRDILACQKELIDAGFEGNASW
jgi:hypothetical protein